MAIDRDSTLKKAEKLLRQGRLEGAIAEYVKVAEDYPKDWPTANTLGDLYVRAGLTEKAAAQYARIADHFAHEGFLPKASALYKKILKIRPDDEATQLQLAEVSARQGLLADAKAQLTAVAERRRARGDRAGTAEIIIRLGSLDPADVDARRTAAQAVADSGDPVGAAQRFRDLAADLTDKGRHGDALEILREVVRCDPEDRDSRARLARAALASGNLEEAEQYLNREVAGDDPALLTALAEVELRAGRLDGGLGIVRELVGANAEIRSRIIELAWELCGANPDAAFGCADAIADQAVTAGEWPEAAAMLQEFVTRVPRHIPALLKLVEVCVDGGLEATMYSAQVQLADAYLDAGQALEASVIAEDLVAREPWETAHIERFRLALVMLKTPNPDAVIAERLSGQSPFTVTDPFAEVPAPATEPPPPPEEAQVAVEEGMPFERPPAPLESPQSVRPVNPAFQVTVGGLDLNAILRDTPAAAPRPAQSGGETDRSGALDAHPEPPRIPLPQPPARNLDQVFQTFRGEASRDSGEAQGEQYLALGRTYRDMGMVDEATRALEAAVRSPRHRFEAASMLASLCKQRGQLVQAVEWMERAVEAPAPSADDGRALLYSLGETLESLGEVARALAVFLELQSDVGSYRDVQARIDRLSRVQTGG